MTSSAAHLPSAPAETTFLPGPVLLLGAPGVGKGTQAQILLATYGIPQISTGDLLRDNISRGTELGRIAKQTVDQGRLVSDDIVNQMVAIRLASPDTARGYVLDGFPRTLNQAGWIDTHLSSSNSALPLIAISIVVDYQQLLRRITGRRISPAGRIYNIYTNPSAVPGIDDVDGSILIQRPDDTEDVFIQRMKTFASQTAPVIEHYRNRQRFQEVDGDQPVEVVTAAIHQALRRLRSIA